MTKRQTPPGRKSKALVVTEKPFGPHHCARCLASVNAVHTVSRGAANTRVPTIARASCARSRLFCSATVLLLWLLCLQRLEVIVEAVEPLLPEPPIVVEPLVDALEGSRFEPAGPPLRRAAAGDQPGIFQHFQMLRDRGSADFERSGELADGGLAKGETRENRAPRRVGEGEERGAEAVGHLDNHLVK